MSGNDKDLNTNQKRALVALLENGTVTGAAAAVGLSEKTIYRYLHDENFTRELDKSIRGLLSAAGVTLYSGTETALKTLAGIMNHARRDSDRRLAAANWLTFVYKHREFNDIENQISEIIRRLDEIENRQS